MSDTEARIVQLENTVAMLTADLARLRDHDSQGRPQELRLGRTYDDGAYPSSGNVFPVTFIDGTYDELAGTRTPTYTERNTANKKQILNIWGDLPAADTPIPVWFQGDRWWTAYTTGGDIFLCTSGTWATGDIDCKVETYNDAGTNKKNIFIETTGFDRTVRQKLTHAVISPDNPDRCEIVCEWIDDDDVADFCANINTVTGFVKTNNQVLTHDVVSSGAPDPACKFDEVCDVMKEETGGDSITPGTRLYMFDPDVSSGACSWKNWCDVLETFDGFDESTNNSNARQIISHTIESSPGAADGACEWDDICTILTELDSFNASTEGQLLSWYVGSGPTTDDKCYWRTLCDMLTDTLLLPGFVAATANQVITHDVSGNCQWGTLSLDVCATIQGWTGWVDSSSYYLGGDCEWHLLPSGATCTQIKALGTIDESQWEFLAHDIESTPAAGDASCAWVSACDILKKITTNYSGSARQVISHDASGNCEWQSFCELLEELADDSALNTSYDYLLKVTYNSGTGAWECGFERIMEPCLGCGV